MTILCAPVPLATVLIARVPYRSGSGPQFVPPTQYSAIWTVLAIATVIGAVLLIIAAVRLTRARPATSDASDIDWMPVIDRAGLRDRYEALIDEAEGAHRSGRMSTRELHQRLGYLVRQFAYETDGVRAPTMTLTDLRASRLDPLGDAVARLYPGEFSPGPPLNTAESVRIARLVVTSWN